MTSSDSIARRPLRQTSVLSMGMLRTGSASICEALTILGYKDVHHGIKSAMSPRDWPLFNQAADAHFSSLSTYTGETFTREQWDELFGPCEAITDMGSFFAPSLIAAYPEAKVIIVERDIEEWYASMEEAIFSTTWGWRADFFIDFLAPLFQGKTGLTIRKIMNGYFEAQGVDDMRRKARARYVRHYEEIRALTPPERLLSYKLQDGWEPLCEFLGKEIPDVPFPRANVRQVHLARIRERQGRFLKTAIKIGLKKAFPWAVGFFAIGAGAVVSWKRPQLVADARTWLLVRVAEGFKVMGF